MRKCLEQRIIDERSISGIHNLMQVSMENCSIASNFQFQKQLFVVSYFKLGLKLTPNSFTVKAVMCHENIIVFKVIVSQLHFREWWVIYYSLYHKFNSKHNTERILKICQHYFAKVMNTKQRSIFGSPCM